jgi:multicomponent Na+:H+ antiporter subunit D
VTALVVLVPLAGALLAFLVGRRAERFVGLLTVGGNLLVCLALGWLVWREGPQTHASSGWGAPLGIELMADGLSAIMLFMTALVAVGVSGYSHHYLEREKTLGGTGGGEELFWPLWLFLLAALNGIFVSNDLFNLYVLLEILGLAAVALAALSGKPAALAASLRYLLVALVASLLYLAGVVLIYAEHGALDLTLLGQSIGNSASDRTAAALIVIGLVVKTALFPLHFWLPPAHSAAIAPVSAVLSALVVKASFYLLVRVWVSLFAVTMTVAVAQLLGALGACAILWGSVQALRQQRIKLLIAHSTVARIPLPPLPVDHRRRRGGGRHGGLAADRLDRHIFSGALPCAGQGRPVPGGGYGPPGVRHG